MTYDMRCLDGLMNASQDSSLQSLRCRLQQFGPVLAEPDARAGLKRFSLRGAFLDCRFRNQISRAFDGIAKLPQIIEPGGRLSCITPPRVHCSRSARGLELFRQCSASRRRVVRCGLGHHHLLIPRGFRLGWIDLPHDARRGHFGLHTPVDDAWICARRRGRCRGLR